MTASVKITNCLNCRAELQSGPYCGVCGQRNVHQKLNWRDLAHEFNTQLLEMDLPWARTLIDLTIRPSTVCISYISGKRVPYVNPIKYVVYMIAFVTLVFPLVQSNVIFSLDLPESAPLIVKIIFNNIPLFILLFSPFAVLLLKLFFWNTLRNWVETTCYVFYMVGHSVLLLLVILLLLRFIQSYLNAEAFNELSSNLQGFVVFTSFVGLPLYWANAAKDLFVANHLWSWFVMFIVCFGYLFGGMYVYFQILEFYGAFGASA